MSKKARKTATNQERLLALLAENNEYMKENNVILQDVDRVLREMDDKLRKMTISLSYR